VPTIAVAEGQLFSRRATQKAPKLAKNQLIITASIYCQAVVDSFGQI
jgi:hypothetical protein